ncbi:3'-5' exonuclease [Pengzhenrongella frigida]|uniref:PAS domain-containing protein n=1 Tax=Pengzhenrongella frigida TaxID=1259133 RepID=A0A4Q5N625_9MICO|nr:exonuclease domain-containing protein [Cellulomonas sp. HLT2-17]RYV52297.1 PAS domain-containing protein [Cellulomonas sp. HLT2-17]
MDHGRGTARALVAGIALYCALVAAVLGLLLWGGLTVPARDAVLGSARGQVALLGVVAAVALVGFIALVSALVGRYARTAARLTAETRLLLHANPDLHLDRSGPPELAELAEAIEQLAERRRVAEREVDAEVGAARAGLEQERNRLATLMAELAVAVVVCTLDGRILLYNTAARSLVDDDDAVGLGRSVFDLIDRDLITRAVDRFAAGSTEALVVTTQRDRQTLRVHLGAVRGSADEVDGFVLLFEDLTGPAPARSPRTPRHSTPLNAASRPEFYDFQLFDWAHGPSAHLGRSLGEVSYTVFDTETTGLDPVRGDEIISVGAVRMVNGRLLRRETFERLVDPRRSVPASSTAIHGLTADMLAGQPTIDAVLPAFARYAQDTVLVGHNVGFDLQFLRLKEARTGVRLRQPVLDTLLLDAALHPDHDDHSLEAIAARLGVEVVDRHTALGDALVTGEVFVRLLTVLRARGVATVGEAAELSRATLQARVGRSQYGTPDG